ncbi:peroxisomal copper amine oxidase [Lichtheimia corymbifera JMRC:FSU:9682]|uniref:Amine oxidase n=1 Tax=Lichtheimia corymbifera JMRC:FSU:9682 TaxID=1263082 RepID=A0A068S5E2_9FUNG|nr:peroxisomal copper amine oxidase [Lichtheimia corymbifera JMRC:FSU:9682]
MKTATAASKRPYAHPLDQLTADEIVHSANIVRAAKPTMDLIFNTITLKEPSKPVMMSYLGWDKSSPRVTHVEREALVILLERPSMKCYEAIVSLDTESVKSFEHIPDVQPILTMDEMFEVEELVVKDPRVAEECRELGIHDMSQVFADPWAIARHVNYPGRAKRMMQAFLYMRTCEDDNQYAHPLDFVPIIDLGKMEIVSIERIRPRDSKFTRPTIPQQNHNFLPEFIGEENFRKDVKPIIVQQPQGVSFTVKGNEIDWQKWNMRISMNYREGLVIHNVSYQDGAEKRPVFYRVSLSEMVVPYADPFEPHYRKHAFDVGEYGLGLCTNSLTLGCDCLGSIYYFDACFNDHQGKPFHMPNAICLHEEDAGVLFKHTDYRNGRAHTVRSRRLVISQIVTVANYDYGLYYYFYQDGTFEYQVKATGELNTHVMAEDETPGRYGVTVAPQINAQLHQHFFTMRIDPMIDGPNNSVVQVDTYPSEFPTGHPRNIMGNGFYAEYKTLKDTHEGQANPCYETARYWKIINENRIHPYTKSAMGWKIMNPAAIPFMPKPDSLVGSRAPFAQNALWVTPYDEKQMFAGGFYCNQSDGSDTLYSWANKERQSIQNKDIVVWLSFGIHHIPRVEDFPIMPVELAGFMLKPANFFIANPAMDVPPSNKAINKSVHADAAPSSSCCSGTTKL